ncbi:MAG: hypothetical protein OQK48_05895 [Sulfurimonas sp.]|uniref:hypothetical protein n=1 Tax=Sulfurimonas sp. TaxID=2022749 RepID=UPI0026216BE3|nr:hypothetical protein [Sulfurimonas sp.]MCW8894662.1 hypothetical protein [Sulfurimonas sp.]MCW8954461.1 hypothetical protein [Sulfurimonas sp.]MCW9067107.1 hypothetical protein [Sulfurimonas sp.]
MNIFTKKLYFPLLFLTIFFPTYIFGADECSSSDYNYSLSAASPTTTHTVAMSANESISYYIQSSEAGTLTITTNNANNKINLNGSENSCPAGVESGTTSLVYTQSFAFDINIVVFADGAATHTLTIQFTPFDSSSEGHLTKYENPFSIIYGGAGTNIYGDYSSIASSVQCVDNGAGGCNYNYTGALYNATTKYENSVAIATIPLNSSTETLNLPVDIDGSDILYAGLYWQGNITGPDSNDYVVGITGRNIVSLLDSSGTVHTLTSDELWYHDFWGDGTGSDGGYRSFYQGYKDITSIVQNSYVKGNINSYTVGNIKSTIGSDYGTYFWADDIYAYNGIRIGFWGNWNLIVVYEHSNVGALSPQPKPKNITLFQGFDALIPLQQDSTKSVNLPLSGFLTPSSTPIEAKLLFYGAGAEKVLNYDTFKIQDGTTSNYIDLSNALNPVDNAFNGSVSSFGIPIDPAISYYPGLDSDEFDISLAMVIKQTSTSLSLSAKNVSGTGDQIFPGLIAFSTDVYAPEFCYDYAYKQQGIYFTEDNNGTLDPRISGDVISGEPIEVSVFIRNLVDSDIAVTDMYVDVLDINTTQATYVTNTTKLAKIGDLTPTDLIDGTDITIGTSSIEDITIGTIDSNEHFYIYYSLDPKDSSIDMPINVQTRYNLVVGGETIPYTLKLGSEIPMCSSTNFTYEPEYGLFNVVHNSYYNYDTGGGNRYYNLPTQVTNREGNFKVIAMDPADLNELQGKSTSVAVELIDASAFHDTYASCQEEESSISEKVQVFFENNATSVAFNQAALQDAINDAVTNLTSTSEFYSMARENVAFRISYGLTNDGNDSLVQHEYDSSNDEFKILNFTQLVQDVGTCVQRVTYDTSPVKTTENVAVACGNAGTFISKKHYYACLECLYGINTRFECSRDNFAIRPEAFMIKINDQNQTNPSSQLRLADSVSGVVTPVATVVDLAAGYEYNLEINATNHLNNNSSTGYTKSFDPILTDNVEYTWQPSGAPTGCNDDNNHSIPMRFVNGSVDINSSLNQVGEYGLNITDTTWTIVDNTQPAHHVGSYFLGGADCIANSSTTQAINSGTLNGCNISSNHDSSGSSLKYRDYNLEFNPYKFNIGITPSHGENNNTIFDANTFIYMSDMSQSPEMSFHLNGWIGAVGYDDSTLSNFVDNCYAKPVTLTINKSLADSNVINYQYNFQNTDPAIVDKNGTINGLSGLINLATNDFNKSNNGNVNTVLNLNFDRNVTTVFNPEELTFTTYDANCTTPANCRMNADLDSTHEAEGYRDLNRTDIANNRITLKHYYGRTHASRQRYDGNTGTANIYYEVYCFGSISGNTCNQALLQNPTGTLKRTDDIRWFMNENHDIINDGNVSIVVQRGGTNIAADIIDATDNPTGNPSITTLNYDASKGYPYKTIMQNIASGWLIYNQDDPTATRNEFAVEFEAPGTGWSGEHETNTTTQDVGAVRTNRRSNW